MSRGLNPGEEVNFTLDSPHQISDWHVAPKHSEGKILIFPNRNHHLSSCQVGYEMRESILDDDLGQIL